MTYKLFLDDERDPSYKDYDAVVARNYDEFVEFITHETPNYISFDHDLGKSKTGYDAAKWLIEYDLDNDILDRDFTFYVHSQNPIGKKNIESILTSYLAQKFKELK